jgi:hypothetical protein
VLEEFFAHLRYLRYDLGLVLIDEHVLELLLLFKEYVELALEKGALRNAVLVSEELLFD